MPEDCLVVPQWGWLFFPAGLFSGTSLGLYHARWGCIMMPVIGVTHPMTSSLGVSGEAEAAHGKAQEELPVWHLWTQHISIR